MHADAAPGRWRWFALAGSFGLLLAWAGLARAHIAAGARAVDVEAAYLVNFLRYTQWPPSRAPAPGAPLVVTVVGSPAVAERVRAVAMAAGTVEGHPIEVRNIASARGSLDMPLDSERDRDAVRQMRESHLVYFSDSAAFPHPRVLTDLYGQPVLTVGNTAGFARQGGMLGLVRRGGNIVFEANPVAIRGAGLVVSAKVLKLARAAR